MLDRPVTDTRPPAERRPTGRTPPMPPMIEQPEGLNIGALIGALRRRRMVLVVLRRRSRLSRWSPPRA